MEEAAWDKRETQWKLRNKWLLNHRQRKVGWLTAGLWDQDKWPSVPFSSLP